MRANCAGPRRWMCIVLAGVLLCVLVGGIVLGVSQWVVRQHRDRLLPPDAPVPAELDCILVLGCGVYPDGTPSPMLRDRMDRACALYHKGWAPKLLLTGDDRPEHAYEVRTMQQLAEQGGVPAEALILDQEGVCTYDSISRAKKTFHIRRAVLVSQEYHLYRALHLSQALGLDAVGVASEGQNYGGQTKRDIREVLARTKDAILAAFCRS